MDLSLTTETFTQSDQRWLGSAHGTDTARPITLDASKFTQATHYPNGFLPSGTVLAIYADGKYGPYDPAGTGGNGDTALGFLLEAVDVKTSTSTPVGALLLHAFVVTANLPFNSSTKGGVDAAGKTDMAGRIIFV